MSCSLHSNEEGPLPVTASSPAPADPVAAGAAAAGLPVSPFEAGRRRLSGRRWHRIERITHKYPDGREVKYDVTVGFYPDGGAGEIFVDPVQDDAGEKWSFKVGSDYEGEIDNQAELASRLMQFGVRPGQLILFCTPGTLLRAAIEVAARLEASREATVPEGGIAAVRALTRAWIGRELCS